MGDFQQKITQRIKNHMINLVKMKTAHRRNYNVPTRKINNNVTLLGNDAAKMCRCEAWVANMKSACDTLVLSLHPRGLQERGSSEGVKPGCKFPSLLSHGCAYWSTTTHPSPKPRSLTTSVDFTVLSRQMPPKVLPWRTQWATRWPQNRMLSGPDVHFLGSDEDPVGRLRVFFSQYLWLSSCQQCPWMS